MLFNPIITDFVKTSHLFHVIIIELKRQKHIYSIILPESKKIMSSKINLNRQRHKGAWLNRIQKEVEKFWPPPLSLTSKPYWVVIRYLMKLCKYKCIYSMADGTLRNSRNPLNTLYFSQIWELLLTFLNFQKWSIFKKNLPKIERVFNECFIIRFSDLQAISRLGSKR